MKIRNESKRVYNFNGGSIAPGRTIEVGLFHPYRILW